MALKFAQGKAKEVGRIVTLAGPAKEVLRKRNELYSKLQDAAQFARTIGMPEDVVNKIMEAGRSVMRTVI